MNVVSHANDKYSTGHRLAPAAAWNSLRVERWRHEAGRLTDTHLGCTEIAVLLDGQVTVQRNGDGLVQSDYGRPGTTWICPAGVFERDIKLSAPMFECLHIFLPPTLLEDWALENYDIDPSKTRLGYAGGLNDVLITQIALTYRSLVDQECARSDRLLIDGLRTTLAAHLVSRYSRDQWHFEDRCAPNTLSGPRLNRVLEFIEANLGEEIDLDALASEACLSPFHFSRLFRQVTGLTPHRYVTERRIKTASAHLKSGHMSLTQIALDTGFGSPANFSRAFRKATGCTPSHYKQSCK